MPDIREILNTLQKNESKVVLGHIQAKVYGSDEDGWNYVVFNGTNLPSYQGFTGYILETRADAVKRAQKHMFRETGVMVEFADV